MTHRCALSYFSAKSGLPVAVTPVYLEAERQFWDGERRACVPIPAAASLLKADGQGQRGSGVSDDQCETCGLLLRGCAECGWGVYGRCKTCGHVQLDRTYCNCAPHQHDDAQAAAYRARLEARGEDDERLIRYLADPPLVRHFDTPEGERGICGVCKRLVDTEQKPLRLTTDEELAEWSEWIGDYWDRCVECKAQGESAGVQRTS